MNYSLQKIIDKIYSFAEIIFAFIVLVGIIFFVAGHPSGFSILKVGLITLSILYVINAFYTFKRSYLNIYEQGFRLFTNFGAALCCLGILDILVGFSFCSACLKIGLAFMIIYLVYFLIYKKKYRLRQDLKYHLKMAIIFFISLMILFINFLEQTN